MSESPYVEVAIPAKPFWQSKTLWWNIATIAVAALGLVVENAATLGLDDRSKVWIGIGISIINAIGNMILRVTPENVPIAATRGQYQIAELPKASAVQPPEHPATAPRRWGRD